MMGLENTAMRRYAGGLKRRQFFAIVCSFWLYVAVSNILYAYGMRTGIAVMTNQPLFAPWNARALQHLLLLPFLLVSYWASLRIQWRPVLVAIPLQLMLGLFFAAIAYPALFVGEITVGSSHWHNQLMSHTVSPWADPMTLSLWLASFVSFLPTYGFGLALVTGLGAVHTVSRFGAASARRSSANGALHASRRCACSCLRTRCSTCCIPSAATSNGIRRRRRPWSCSSRICCAGC